MAKKGFKDTFLNIQTEAQESTIGHENETIEVHDSITQSSYEESINAELIEAQENTVISKNSQNLPKVVTTKELQVTESLNERIQRRVVEIEKEIKSLKRVGFGTGKKRYSFDDMYGGKTISMNRLLKPLFDEICDTASITKAEIVEKILINGIKNTNFNPPDEE